MSKFKKGYLNFKLFSKHLTWIKNEYYIHTSSIKYNEPRKSINGLKKEFPKEYNPKLVEKGWYEWWQNEGYFSPNLRKKPIFSMIIPPPNITGFLHLGHALTVTIEDILVRWKRQLGNSVIWMPGIDHAGIATQVVVEKTISNQSGLTRHDLGREEFLKKVWEWRTEKGNHIETQLCKLGLSLDWNKHIFTMDNRSSEAVNEAFLNLFEKGLIYRKDGLVNWSCELQSTISDIEIETREFNGLTLVPIPGHVQPVAFGQIYDFAYKTESEDEEIIVSTTRPETMLGDVAIAVHPEDPRYLKFHGKAFKHPFRKEMIPLIVDDMVDINFGTGAVKITPAHSLTDFEVGQKHKLPSISILNEEGRIINSEEFKEFRRYEARNHIIDALQNLNLMRDIRDHNVLVPFCSRSGDAIEFILKPQWFLKCKDMAAKAKEAVINGSLTIDPKNFEKEWFKWLDENRDWCISRQLWWGHRIPIYHCKNRKDTFPQSIFVAAKNENEARIKATSQLKIIDPEDLEIKQDEDVLDTWFSSSIFPLVACGWPHKDPELSKYFPLSMIDTGHDILFFWVARIVMLSQALTNQLPFKSIFLHGMIIDSFGRKMSKSLGNLILPEDIINGISLQELHNQNIQSYESGLISKEELSKAIDNQKKLYPGGISECGSDALRFTLCSHNVKNLNIHFDVIECVKNRQFCNKIWQASKFILHSINYHGEKKCLDVEWNASLLLSDTRQNQLNKWIVSRLSYMVNRVNQSLNEREFHIGADHLKTFIYDEFCNHFLETSKIVLKSEPGNEEALNTCRILLKCFRTGLICLSPYMPFITEELYQRLPFINETSPSVMIHPYPTDSEWSNFRNLNIEDQLNNVFTLTNELRRIVVFHELKKQSEVFIETNEFSKLLEKHKDTLVKLTGMTNLKLISKANENIKCLAKEETLSNCAVYFSSNKTFCSEDRKILLEKERKINEKLDKLKNIYYSSDFINKASQQSKEDYDQKMKKLEGKLNKILKSLKHFET